jgi:hypothetical protein
VGVDPAAGGTYEVIGSITFVRPTIPDGVDTRSTEASQLRYANTPGADLTSIRFTLTFRNTEDEFEALNAEIARRGPTFEVDRTGRCMVCGEFRCAWWAAFCAWRDGKGPRPNWRDGSIDTTCSEVGAQVLIESSSMK